MRIGLKKLLKMTAISFAISGFAASAMAQPALTFHTPDQGEIADLATVVQFSTVITNTGTAADSFTIAIARDLPAPWTASLCEGATCYPPFVTEITVALAPGQDTNLDVDVTPLNLLGGGSVTVVVTSSLDPQLYEKREFTVITPGLDVLVVAADNGAGREAYATTALTAASKPFGVWPRQQAGALTQADFAGFGAVLWLAGPYSPGLTQPDLGPLAYYVQHGGGLLLSGQDLAWSACDPGSPHYSPAAASWYQAILGVAYLSNAGGDDQLMGLPTEPLLNSFSALLSGGTGANDNSSPDEISPTSGSTSLHYQNGAAAAVRHTYGDGRSFFCGFGFENLASDTNRVALINAVLAWFDPPTAVPEARPSLAASLHPNPFNPATSIAWQLPHAGPLRITVHDLSGRRMSVVHDRPAPAGSGSMIWQGKSDSGKDLPSGVYLCRIQFGQQTVMRKMTLVR